MRNLIVIFLLLFGFSNVISQEYLKIITNDTFNFSSPLTGWTQNNNLPINSSASVEFSNGITGFYRFLENEWILEGVITSFYRNNLMQNANFIERGNIEKGGGQDADFSRNIYNWLGSDYSDVWESAEDSLLFQINGSQTVNSINTTNFGNGAVNIGTSGANGKYKLNVLGAMWLDNGRNSVLIGNSAGLNDTSHFSVNIGPYAADNNSGNEVVFLGYLSGESNTGSNSVGIGSNSGRFNQGNNLISIGNDAGRNSNGLSNVLVGSGAGTNNNSNFLIAIGQEAAYRNEGDDCIGIGRETLYNNKGFENIGIGKASLFNNDIGSRNTAVGTDALKQNISGNNNTMLGWRAGFNVLSGDNTFVGESAADRTTIGTYNTFIGNQTAHDNRTGSENTALGYSALYALNTVTPETVVIGEQYQIHSVGTTDWVAMGATSNLQDLQFTAIATGTGNGIPVSINPINGNNNTAIGHRALYYNGVGSGNVAIGHMAGNNNNGLSNKLYIANSATNTPLIGGDFSTQEVKIGGVQQFSIQYPPSGSGVPNGSIFYGTDGALYFKGGNGSVTQLGVN